MTNSSTVLHHGCPIAYDLRGAGPRVLFVQGVGVHGDGWLPQVEPLAARYSCLTFDNRGMGRSQPAGAAVTVEQMADDARAVLDAAGWESAHVVGHSLGGLAAVYLALAHRRRVRSLTLMCTFADGRAVAPLTLRMIWAGLRMKLGTRRMRRRGFLQLLLPPGAVTGADADALAERLAPLFGHDLADAPPVVNDQLKAMRAADATPRLGELAGIPTLVMCGTHDPIAPPTLGKALASGSPGAKFIEYADASHGLPIQWPERVNAKLEEFWQAAG
jgi:pimeloyl-ACP methyl ester carboxylesterase